MLSKKLLEKVLIKKMITEIPQTTGPSVAKMLERLVHRKIVSVLEKKGLLSGYQYITLGPIAKAFDSVPHYHLLYYD